MNGERHFDPWVSTDDEQKQTLCPPYVKVFQRRSSKSIPSSSPSQPSGTPLPVLRCIPQRKEVCKIPCQDSDQVFVGEMGRTVKKGLWNTKSMSCTTCKFELACSSG